MPLTTEWRAYGAADGAHGHGLAVSLCAAGLAAHSHSGPSLRAHAPRRTDTALRACRCVGGTSQGELHDFQSTPVVGLALQEASPPYDGYHPPKSGGKTGPSRPSPSALTPYDGPGTT